MTKVEDDALFYKLKDLIREQSEGEWADEMIERDARRFADQLAPMFPTLDGGSIGEGDQLSGNSGELPAATVNAELLAAAEAAYTELDTAQSIACDVGMLEDAQSFREARDRLRAAISAVDGAR